MSLEAPQLSPSIEEPVSSINQLHREGDKIVQDIQEGKISRSATRRLREITRILREMREGSI